VILQVVGFFASWRCYFHIGPAQKMSGGVFRSKNERQRGNGEQKMREEKAQKMSERVEWGRN